MSEEIKQRIKNALLGGIQLQSRADIEAQYPQRQRSEGQQVTRLCPSPTGFVHIGTIFTGLICERVAHQSDGTYILRIEDTDKKREVEGAKELITEQLGSFGIPPDEGIQPDGSVNGKYGPYVQSERRDIYLTYACELLDNDRAYPCFATSEELEAAVEDQKARKQRPGYYGEWALWRNKSDKEVNDALDSGKPFVLRFKSSGSHEKRVTISDRIKGKVDLPQNDLDVPLIKMDGSLLPTYHLAHVVDDYLMRVTLVMRGEEWLPSTPLHADIAIALGIKPFKYAHTPVISILDSETNNKRKLSKRKDPEADVAFWLKQAYPIKAVKAYLLGLANSNFDDWFREDPSKDVNDFDFSLDKLKNSRSPLLDVKKLEDYSKDVIASISQGEFNKHALAWTELHDRELFDAMMVNPEFTSHVFSIERGGDKPRKDVAKWSDVPEQFGYFYDDIFEQRFKPLATEELSDFSSDVLSTSRANFLDTYDSSDDKDTWFEKMKASAEKSGFTLDRKELKANPEKYNGSIADYARIIRVSLTGKRNTPDLYQIMKIIGNDKVIARLN